MAIHGFVRRPMDCFVPRNDGAGWRNDGGGVVMTLRARRCEEQPTFRHCEAQPIFRHCEARSAVAIHGFVRRPMDCFVPRNDGAGWRNDGAGWRNDGAGGAMTGAGW